ncbi:MAG: cupin domain-containing protein [Chitinophagales bacterium]
MNIEYLLGSIDKKSFFNEFYQKKHLYIKRNDKSYYDNILTLKDIDEYLSKKDIRYPSIRVVKNGLKIDKYKYLKDIPYGDSCFTELLDNDKLYKLYKDGSTIVLQSFQRHIESLRRLSLELHSQILCEFQANLYLTPKLSQGFAAHYDAHDVLILQIHGKKEWYLYESPEFLPTKNQTFFSTPHCQIDWDNMKPTFHKTIEEGDLLYIPRGLVHKAVTTDTTSLHITFGMFPQKWHNLLAYIANSITEFTDFREALPIYNKTYQSDYILNELKNKFDKVIDSSKMKEFVVDYIDKYTIQKRMTSDLNRLLDFEKLEQVCENSVIQRRKEIIFRIEKDSQSHLIFYDKKVTLPIFMNEAIAYVAKNEKFKIRDLPNNIDIESKILFTKKLIEEGFLTISYE